MSSTVEVVPSLQNSEEQPSQPLLTYLSTFSVLIRYRNTSGKALDSLISSAWVDFCFKCTSSFCQVAGMLARVRSRAVLVKRVVNLRRPA